MMRIYRSDTIEVSKDQNLTELLHSSAYPDLPESHLIAKDSLTNRSITIGKLRERAARIAKGIQTKCNPPDQARWAIILPNSVDFLEAVHAILWTGGIFCPINHALRAAEIGHGLAVSRPHFVVVYGVVLPTVEEALQVARKELADRGVSWARPRLMTVVSRAKELPHFPDDFIAEDRLLVPHWSDTATRVASIHLSSGTTGKPKGVELTHRNFVANCHQLLAHDRTQFHPRSRMVAFTPWAHIGMTTLPLFLGPYAGMLHHAMPRYELSEFLRLVASDQATSFQGVPSVLQQLADPAHDDLVARHSDLSRSQFINVGGPLPADLERRLLRRAPWRLVQVYGMTEAAGYVAYQHTADPPAPRGVTGRLLPGVEACLRTTGGGTDAPEGGPGELWLRGPNIARRYAFDEEANARAFGLPMARGEERGRESEEGTQGWYNTGDVCTIDGAGRVSVVGRTKELIKYKGFQVSPSELEALAGTHPAVEAVGAGATWDERGLTELPTAWVVLRGGLAEAPEVERRTTLRAVQRHVDTQVSGYKKLRGGVWEVHALPRNATGKVLRQEMAAMRDGLCSLDPEPRKAML
ncbi:AMP-binding enzyme [Durotheca rogersii]|uniref:AMP-binding enzyme n=1 Tax=Durotheca rogersii TaxID=419775 RepID=UPI00221F3A03|nr:AMP-binding enzyme [Durotheca rogersii]KAI5865782.1 AMP-binding enzyme [Durotheca rogersii]